MNWIYHSPQTNAYSSNVVLHESDLTPVIYPILLRKLPDYKELGQTQFGDC